MDVLADAGHLVHEDKPLDTAQILSVFFARQRLAEPAKSTS